MSKFQEALQNFKPAQGSGKFNVIADGWLNGKYCLGQHVSSLEEAQRWADRYAAKYEGQPFPNGRGWYECRNFRLVEVPVGEKEDIPHLT